MINEDLVHCQYEYRLPAVPSALIKNGGLNCLTKDDTNKKVFLLVEQLFVFLYRYQNLEDGRKVGKK